MQSGGNETPSVVVAPVDASVSTGAHAASPPDATRPHPGTLQKLFVLWFIAAAFMLTLGRAMLGSSGWIMVISILTVAPFLSFYGLIVSAIIYTRWKKTGYIFSQWMKNILIIFMFSTLTLSLTIVDGGDTSEGVTSVLTRIFGINGENGMDSPLMNMSLLVANISGIVMVITLILMFVLAFVDGRRFGKQSQ